MQDQRFATIREHLYRVGTSTVVDLASLTQSSKPTIRRDLQRLEAEGVVRRVHGGAQIVRGAGEGDFKLRETHNIAHKRAIAAAAFALLRPGQTVFLDSGTTILQLACRLRLSPLPLTVVTNGLPVAQELLGLAGVRVIVTGGQLRAENLSLVGPFAERQLEAIRCDRLFLGAGAIAADGRIYCADDAEAAMNAAMLAHAEACTVLADASKFGQHAPFAVAPLGRITQVISDDRLAAEWRATLARLGVALTLVPAAQVPP